METKVVDGKFIERANKSEMFQISQKMVLFDTQKQMFLVAKVADEEGFYAKRYGVWDLPGGKIDVSDQSLEEALAREVKEEIGDVRYGTVGVIGVQMADYLKGKALLVGYLGIYDSGDIVLSSEHTEYNWVTLDDVGKNEIYGPLVRQFIANATERLKEREYLNDAKRIYADFENYRRRQEERMKELSTVCAEGFALDMIPVIDNFRAAALHVPEEEKTKAWMTGITYIGKQIEEVLATRGLVAYEAREGEMFDPYLHEAVSHEKGKEGEEGKIVKSLQPGYKMETRVIRPAKVIVG